MIDEVKADIIVLIIGDKCPIMKTMNGNEFL